MAQETGLLVVFHLPEGSSTAQHRTFRRRIYGEETSSWGGRYQYHRKGILDSIPHVFLYWGIVIVKKSDAPRLIERIKENGGLVETLVVQLRKSDKMVLDRKSLSSVEIRS
jgi:hypothetical protein